jgi:hypothetical protein
VSRLRRSPLARALPWLLAVAAAVFAGALWRRWAFPVRSRRRDVARVPRGPVPLPPDPPGRAPLQPPSEGAGPRFHRRYCVDVADPALGPEDLMALVGRDPDAFSPAEIARFEKTRGAEGRLAVGDEFLVRISSPWNGPVRVIACAPRSFTLGTLEGHLEAGQIRFAAGEHPSVPGALRFTIESWARSRDGPVDLAYDKVGVAQKAQEAMWTFFCDRVATAAGGRKLGEIEVLTEREANEG